MVSASTCERRGFGIHVSNEEWANIEPIYAATRAAHEWFRLCEPLPGHTWQIGMVFFDYGCNKVKNDSTREDYTQHTFLQRTESKFPCRCCGNRCITSRDKAVRV